MEPGHEPANVIKIPNAVVGIVDIVASTKISNKVDLALDWQLRTLFFTSSRECASSTGVSMINHTGDGFVFLLDRDNNAEWPNQLLEFHRLLTEAFERILESMRAELAGIQSGLRFGVSAGPVLLGTFGGRGELHVVGTDVNMAARLCVAARVNEIVLSSRVWYLMTNALQGRAARKRVYRDLKGFECEVPALHLVPVSQNETALASAEIKVGEQKSEESPRKNNEPLPLDGQRMRRRPQRGPSAVRCETLGASQRLGSAARMAPAAREHLQARRARCLGHEAAFAHRASAKRALRHLRRAG